MEISREALLLVIKATRTAMRMAEDMQRMVLGKGETTADQIAGYLEDALLIISGEQQRDGKMMDLDNSETERLLTSDLLDDDSVAGWFFMMNSIREKHLATKEELPKPQTMSKEDMRDLYQKNGGYMTPEGDWK